MNPSKIAFVFMGSFSHVNEQVMRFLSDRFPDFVIDVIDLNRELSIKNNLSNIISISRLYGLDFLLGRRKLVEEVSHKAILTRTPYFYYGVKRYIEKRLDPKKYTFSFQTQSLFDASREGLAHFVYTDHAHLANMYYPNFDESMLYSNRWIDLERKIYQNASIIFTTSNFASRCLVEDYACKPEKVVCVYSGINIDPDIDVKEKSYIDKHILFVGIQWERKGGPMLVDAFRRVLKRHPDARLTIIGCRPKIDAPRVSVIGRIPISYMRQYYSDATVFCLPSQIEPSAAVVAEAAAHGLPVVSTNIGGTPDRVIHGKTGYLVSPGDLDKLTYYLIDLLDSQEKRREFGQKGHLLAMKRFLWNDVGTRIAKRIIPSL